MKKNVFKLIALALALLTLLASGALVACVETTPSEDDTTQKPNADVVPDETTGIVYEFPTADYKNKEFIVISGDPEASSYPSFYIDTDMATDTMSSAVYTRNTNTEDYYKITITQRVTSDISDTVKGAVDTNTFDFDVVLHTRSDLAGIAKSNYLYDFNDLGIDYTRPWWDANCADGYEICGRLFIMANDTSVSNLAGARFLYFNKNIIKDFQLKNPHDFIRSDDWTLENFLSLVTAVHEENGDGVADGQDVYGLIQETGSTNGVVMHWLVGCGVKFSEKDKDGRLVVNLDANKVADILSTLGTVLKSNECVTDYTKSSAGADTSAHGNKFNYCRALFAQDHFLFIQANMGVSNQFSEIEGSGYGIAPNPKFNKDQDRYYHKMDKLSKIWAVPNGTSLDYECIANVMDYWAYQSSKTVMPAYYEITIKTRRVVDPFDSEMLDVIKGSIVYDLSELLGVGITDSIWNGYEDDSFASSWRINKTIASKALGKLNNAIEALE